MRRKLFNIGGGGGGGAGEASDANFNTCGGILQKCTYSCMRTHINVHMKTHVHAPKYSYSHACMHAHAYVCMHAHADTSKLLYIYILT